MFYIYYKHSGISSGKIFLAKAAFAITFLLASSGRIIPVEEYNFEFDRSERSRLMNRLKEVG